MPPPTASIPRWVTAAGLLVATVSMTTGVAARWTDHPTNLTDDTRAVGIRSDSSTDDTAAVVSARAMVEQFGPTTGEHVELINADAWHAAGIDGAGITIGIIDFFDIDLYWNEAEHGARPVANATAACFDSGADCTDEFFDGVDAGGEEHGVAVVETILDAAPGARILIGQALTVDDYRRLVDWFVERDVDVISRSLGSRYDGPGDGRGPLNDVVDSAVERGVLWVNSAGNNGRNKYYRHPVRLVDDRVAFGPGGDETFLRFTGCVALGGIRWAGDWDLPPSQRTDYDAFLWESPTGDPRSGSIVASSQRRQQLGATPIENIASTRCPSLGTSLYLEVRWVGGDISGDVLEVLDYGSGIADFTTSEGSAAVPVVDSVNPGVLAVGAIDPPDEGIVARYSSRGPSNDGRVLPDLVAPANFSNTVQGRFAGTSAAAAAVAGASALVLAAGLATDPVSAADLMRHLTSDRGAPGDDNEYGHGEFGLPAPPDFTTTSAPSTFIGLDVPERALDTRSDSATGPTELIGLIRRGDILDLPIAGFNGVPTEGVTAVAVNVVSVEADRPSYLQVVPTNGATLGGYSNLNLDAAGQTRANFAIIPLGSDGSISIYSIAEGHVVVDVLGWFETSRVAVAGGRFVELDEPERVLDTRRDPPIQPLRSDEVRAAPMPSGVDPAEVAALVVTVTAAGPTDPGWIQAFPTGRPDVVAKTSTVNTSGGGAVANTAIVPVIGGGISLTGFFASNGSSDVIVDVIGYISSSAAPAASAGRYVPVVPSRAHDSRSAGAPLLDGESIVVNASAAPGVSVPDSATGVVWNAAIVGASRPGFARAWSVLATEPETSALNWSVAGEFRAGAVVTSVDEGRVRFRIDDGSADLPAPLGDLIVDVFGYFT